MHEIPCPLALALARAGSSSAARMAMMATTTSSSISVNACLEIFFIFLQLLILPCFQPVVILVNWDVRYVPLHTPNSTATSVVMLSCFTGLMGALAIRCMISSAEYANLLGRISRKKLFNRGWVVKFPA